MATPTKLEQRGNKLRERLEKLADSQDEKIAAKATSDLLTMHVAEVEAESREDRIAPLRDEIKELTRALKAADETLEPMTAERDALLTEVTALREQVTTLTPVQDQLTAMIAENADWKKAQHALLVGENQQRCWDAQRAENAAKETLETAQQLFGQAGLQLVLDEMKKIVEQFGVPEPALESLPAGISSVYLTIWGHSPTHASYMLAYHKSFPEPSENFKQALRRVLRPGQLQLEGMRKPDPIPDLDVKREVLTAMAVKWNVLNEVQRIADNEDVQCRADFLRTHYADLAAAQHASSLRGEGRTPIVSEQPVSVTGYTGPHDPLCACGRPGCSPLPEHLRMDTWLGTQQTEKVEDINARHADPEVLSYGNQLIEREAAAKKGKVIKVDVPESMALGEGHSMDDEEGAL